MDHINRTRHDDRIENLRELSNAENVHNSVARFTSASGIKGVYFHARMKRWSAQIVVNGMKHHLGYFDTKEQAGIARSVASEKLLGRDLDAHRIEVTDEQLNAPKQQDKRRLLRAALVECTCYVCGKTFMRNASDAKRKAALGYAVSCSKACTCKKMQEKRLAVIAAQGVK